MRWRTGALRDRTHSLPVFVGFHGESPEKGPDPPGQLSHTKPDGLKPTSPAGVQSPPPPTPTKPCRAGVPGREYATGPNTTSPVPQRHPEKLRRSPLRNKAGRPGGRASGAPAAERDISGGGSRPALLRLRPHALPRASAAQRAKTETMSFRPNPHAGFHSFRTPASHFSPRPPLSLPSDLSLLSGDTL